MATSHLNKQDLRIADLEQRLREAEETLRAIQSGEVDALVVNTPEGEQVFTMRGAETTYRVLVEAMNEGALLLMSDGTVLYANTRFADLAGAPLEQVIGKPIQRFFLEQEHEAFSRLLGRAKRAGASQEFHLQRASAPLCPVSVSLASVRATGVDGFSAVVTDLSGSKAAEAKLREMVGELESVSYAIVHDMRAPLRAMEGFAHLLAQDLYNHSPEERKDLTRRITTAASRLDELIRDALSYNNVVLEPISLRRIDLAKLLPDLLETYPNLSPEKADIEIETGLPVVLGNEALLTRCFGNLLDNAVKFVAPGVRPRVRVWAEAAGEFTRVWVEDNGIGISTMAQERLFRMFQRLIHGYEGTGIGLAIVRKVAERMGGKVGVDSKAGEGSRFWVELKQAKP